MSDLSKAPFHERHSQLLETISSGRFLKMQGLGNEVPFFICPFSPDEKNEFVDDVYKPLIKNLAQNGVTVLETGLYTLAIDLMRKRGRWEDVITKEPQLSKDELRELLQGILDPEAHLIPAIAQKMAEQEFDVLFIHEVGEVYPYIRSHTVLNNLQSVAKDHPTVMFFPGAYTQSAEEGAALELFGRINGDKYYRAFNIYHV
ncbi:MAG: DUF1788 domain-containing protein [Chloroflexi bacterium]|nr:MAG: DUF1788 domain-containing protein [Chloroflexota bacterium]